MGINDKVLPGAIGFRGNVQWDTPAINRLQLQTSVGGTPLIDLQGPQIEASNIVSNYASRPNAAIMADGAVATNPILATAGTPEQDSDGMFLAGSWWNGAAAKLRDVRWQTKTRTDGSIDIHLRYSDLYNPGAAPTTWTTTFEFTQGGNLTVPGFIEGSEIADPVAPAANKGRIYFKDNGAGKTQLVVRFPTGVVQILATEP